MKTLCIVCVAVVFLVGPSSRAQTTVKSKSSEPLPLAQEQVSIYRDFLAHYEDYQQLSNLLGMQPVTEPFKIDISVGGIERSVYGPKGCLHALKLEPQSGTVHRLPPEIMRFGDPDSVMSRIKATGQPLPRSKGAKGVGPDGYVLTKFTLSEIVFDVTHHFAVFNFSANCGCLGGQGATILYERKGGKWTKSQDCDYWIG